MTDFTSGITARAARPARRRIQQGARLPLSLWRSRAMRVVLLQTEASASAER